jgi:hypothetical protein
VWVPAEVPIAESAEQAVGVQPTIAPVAPSLHATAVERAVGLRDVGRWREDALEAEHE